VQQQLLPATGRRALSKLSTTQDVTLVFPLEQATPLLLSLMTGTRQEICSLLLLLLLRTL
jgi:hypothetical protein